MSMIKKDGGTYARETEYYGTSPYWKKRMWLEIVEAAKVVIAKGGGHIRFVPPIDDSERLWRERNKKEQKWLRDMR